MAQSRARDDFNGDGRSDLLWRENSGMVTTWLGASNGGFVPDWANFHLDLGLDWSIVGTGDFNGDGRYDFLLRGAGGNGTDRVLAVLQTSSAGFQSDWDHASQTSSEWMVLATGDFNGDGSTDLLWRNAAGQVTTWLSRADGSDTVVDVPGATYIHNTSVAFYDVPPDWTMVGAGDFNGDGKADLLWRNSTGVLTNWLGSANGSFNPNAANLWVTVPGQWYVAGIGDFNGDSIADILWRDADGVLTDWLGTSAGAFVPNASILWASVPTDWSVAATGDYNGDGKDDILWRNSQGLLTDWLAIDGGGFAANGSNLWETVYSTWQVQPNPAGLGAWDY